MPEDHSAERTCCLLHRSSARRGFSGSLGARFAAELLRIAGEKGIEARVYGKGLFFSLELPEGMAERVCREAKTRRVLLGRAGNRIVLRTPLVLTEEDVQRCCDVVRAVL